MALILLPKILKNKFTIIFVLLVLIILIYLFIKRNPSSNRLGESAYKFRECMEKAGKIYMNEVEIFFKEFKICVEQHISIEKKKMDKFEGNNGKKEIFLPVIGKEKGCKWLTIGIDNTTKVESNFNKKYPHCLIYGADPYPSQIFLSVGKVFSFGIDHNNTFNTAIVSINGAPKEVQVHSLPNLLKYFIRSKMIYYLKMDIEGYEYKIMDSLLIKDKRYLYSELTFCQISVNLYIPTKLPSSNPAIKELNMVKFILKFLQNSSPYLPIYCEPYDNYQKITFINVHNPLCQKAFKFSDYFFK